MNNEEAGTPEPGTGELGDGPEQEVAQLLGTAIVHHFHMKSNLSHFQL